jgi:hypothetical protein
MRGTRPCEHPRTPANTHAGQGTCDANAPPIRSPKTPNAPSTTMLGGLIAREDEGLFSAKSASWGQARARSVHSPRAARQARSPGDATSPPGPVRRPRGCRRRCPPAHWIQYSGPTHASSMEALPRWPEKSARTGARPHNGSTTQLRVSDPYFSTDHNPAIRNNAP